MRNIGRLKYLGLITIVTAIGLASAVWIASMQLEGTIVSTNTATPSAFQCDMGEFNLDIGTVEKQCEYQNPDGQVDMSFSFSSNATSSDGSCVYEPGEDFTVIITVGSNNSTSLLDDTGSHQAIFAIPAGSTNISVELNPSDYICPIVGSFQVLAELI